MKINIFLSDEQDKLSPPEDIEKLIELCTAGALEEDRGRRGGFRDVC